MNVSNYSNADNSMIELKRYDVRFSSARARYTAAVCAAGPLPMITTLLCIFLLLRPAVLAGVFCFCSVAAAAMEIPAPLERKEKRPRRKAEENSLTIVWFSLRQILLASWCEQVD
jgi:hypothetical protein